MGTQKKKKHPKLFIMMDRKKIVILGGHILLDRPYDFMLNKANSTNLYPPTKGYFFRETC